MLPTFGENSKVFTGQKKNIDRRTKDESVYSSDNRLINYKLKMYYY
jgi:hypothetical protein